jgi:hypothetical protein
MRMLASWVWWLMTGVVVPLLRGCFYCTESEQYRQLVFYYRWGTSRDCVSSVAGVVGLGHQPSTLPCTAPGKGCVVLHTVYALYFCCTARGACFDVLHVAIWPPL